MEFKDPNKSHAGKTSPAELQNALRSRALGSLSGLDLEDPLACSALIYLLLEQNSRDLLCALRPLSLAKSAPQALPLGTANGKVKGITRASYRRS